MLLAAAIRQDIADKTSNDEVTLETENVHWVIRSCGYGDGDGCGFGCGNGSGAGDGGGRGWGGGNVEGCGDGHGDGFGCAVIQQTTEYRARALSQIPINNYLLS